MADIIDTIKDKLSGLGQFGFGSEILSRLAGNNRTLSAPAPPPSAEAAKSLAMLAEESAKRNKVRKPMTMSPEAKKKLMAK